MGGVSASVWTAGWVAGWEAMSGAVWEEGWAAAWAAAWGGDVGSVNAAALGVDVGGGGGLGGVSGRCRRRHTCWSHLLVTLNLGHTCLVTLNLGHTCWSHLVSCPRQLVTLGILPKTRHFLLIPRVTLVTLVGHTCWSHLILVTLNLGHTCWSHLVSCPRHQPSHNFHFRKLKSDFTSFPCQTQKCRPEWKTNPQRRGPTMSSLLT